MRSGATITGNTKTWGDGGGVRVGSGNFEMTGGTISNNTTKHNGGGVYNGDTFVMSGGIISGNTAIENEGGGVNDGGNFTMTGGTISGNTAKSGGGVRAYSFTMRGGTITANTAREYGGGVYCPSWAFHSFTKTGGIITGYNTDKTNGNIVKDTEGTIARRGHAVYINENRRKESSSGPETNLSHNTASNWDN